jgi:hypothetical protein
VSGKTESRNSPFSAKAIVTALAFGAAALVIVLTHLTVPIPGTEVVTDPRELFASIGAALSGPVGGAAVGILAGIAVPRFPAASVIAHIVGGVWMGIAYKRLVYKQSRMLAYLLGWVGIVLAYYYLFLMPSFIAGLALIYGERVPFARMYADIAEGALPEALLTALMTTIAMSALPGKYRRPLW